MVGTENFTNEKYKFYNSNVQAIYIGGGYCAKKAGSLCSRFVDMRAPLKIQAENGLCKILYLWGQNIDMSDQ